MQHALRLGFALAAILGVKSSALGATLGGAGPCAPSSVISLDGDAWLLAPDPKNVGRQEEWWKAPRPDAKRTKVPWIIQDAFPGYHGVAWYWRDFPALSNPHPQGRTILRFWAVDYRADVWLNGVYVGGHEGGETPFCLDVTDALQTNSGNLLAVRVLNPSDEPMDGIVLKQTPHRNKTSQFTCGCDYNHGGIEDSVELLLAPVVRIEDLFVRCDPNTGAIRIQANVRNALSKLARGRLEFTVAPAASGETLGIARLERELAPGDALIEAKLQVENPRLWELNDPYLYRLTARVWTEGANPGLSKANVSFDERSARCGFRDFRLENGYFRLNGRRIFLRSSVTGNMSPIGIHVAYDPDWFRRDLINCKAMGFNAIRFYGLATRFQLDSCDEIGLMVYEEPYSSQLFEDSPKMAERFDGSTAEMIRRDRNHPSVIIWGLLNETLDSPQFRHAVDSLSLVRSLDDSRVVLLSSGRFDGRFGIGSISNPGSRTWEFLLGDEHEGAPPKPKEALVYPSSQGAGDAHLYPQVPHKADAIRLLRTFGENTKPVFLSEYGIASALDLTRMARDYEQRSKQSSGEGRFYRQALDLFMADWERWKMAECFGRPEDYFRQCLASMAGQRLQGINALRANPKFIGYSLTGTVDQGYTGEGLTTTFRELKPGTVDALFDGLAPLRWCLFVEPVNIYRGAKVKLEAVLANEDVLMPGEYPVCFEVFGPHASTVWQRKTTVKIADRKSNPEPPLSFAVISEDVGGGWPSGKYRFVATFERGGAAAGGEAEFYVADPAEMPAVKAEVVLWGDDPALARWLTDHGIRYRPFTSGSQTKREVILAGSAAPAPGGVEVFRELARHIARGSTAVFVDSHVFAYAGEPISLSSIGKKGSLVGLNSNVYHKDDWSKVHPIFDGLPSGGLMDYTFYRENIGNLAWSVPDAPAEAVAGAIYAFTAYGSGLLVSVDNLGAGRFILNTLRIRENLGRDPAAERLLRNMLRYAARDAQKPVADLPPDFDETLKKFRYH